MKRYSLRYTNTVDSALFPSTTGAWVRYADVEALEALNEELVAALARLLNVTLDACSCHACECAEAEAYAALKKARGE